MLPKPHTPGNARPLFADGDADGDADGAILARKYKLELPGTTPHWPV